MIARRKFFGLLGATPLAAKTALDESIGKQAGISIRGDRTDWVGEPSGGPSTEETEKAHLYLKTMGIPDFVKQTLLENAKRVSSLDPDIANKRSFSMAHKVLMQRQRNYEIIVAKIKTRAAHDIGRSMFQKTMGWCWPWWHHY